MQKIPSENLAIDRKNRLNQPAREVEYRSPEERVKDFEEISITFDEERARQEAARCLHCPDPAICTLACPANNDIPSIMWLTEQGRFLEAAAIYRQYSSLPEVCGRVCPHTDLCAGACVLGKDGVPIRTGELEAFVIDYARRVEGVEVPVAPSSGKKVAVVGGGPAGLACAEQLVQLGHEVTVFEAKPVAGGLLLYGIPNFKLSKKVLFERIGDLEKAGIKFVKNTQIGKEKAIDDLFKEGFGAVFVGVGANIDAPMNIPGEDLPGVHKATEFLIRTNVDEKYLPPGLTADIDIRDKRIVVIGGGDTASDCLRSSLRLGAREVICAYRRTEKEMPGSPKDRKLTRQEGAQYHFLTQPVKFIVGDDGRLAALECIEMELGEPDEGGRRRPIPKEGTNFIFEADIAIKALGNWPDPTIGETTPDLETGKWGLVIADPETGATSRSGVFAGGDAVSGPDLVVTAMVAGRKAAKAIDEFLKK